MGAVGGIYGIGGGSILGPILVGLGFSVLEVAPAALTATPDWGLGIGMGAGGLAGTYLGARLQTRLPEAMLRRGLGLLAVALGARYTALALI